MLCCASCAKRSLCDARFPDNLNPRSARVILHGIATTRALAPEHALLASGAGLPKPVAASRRAASLA
ncbi:protein of unknown function [Hyphomicrobium sp. MC1]|nr:protein of unknown function [Hyphomicrobium sp. MC1]